MIRVFDYVIYATTTLKILSWQQGQGDIILFKCKKWAKLFNSLRSLQNVQFCSSSRKAKILTTGIYCIFRGLKFEPDAEIGQKGTLCKGLSLRLLKFQQGY